MHQQSTNDMVHMSCGPTFSLSAIRKRHCLPCLSIKQDGGYEYKTLFYLPFYFTFFLFFFPFLVIVDILANAT